MLRPGPSPQYQSQVLPNNNGSRGRSCTQKLSAHVDLSNAATEKKCPKCQFVSFSVSLSLSRRYCHLAARQRDAFVATQTKILINHNETRKIFFKKSAIAKGVAVAAFAGLESLLEM